jgi:hypothetical protein
MPAFLPSARRKRRRKRRGRNRYRSLTKRERGTGGSLTRRERGTGGGGGGGGEHLIKHHKRQANSLSRSTVREGGKFDQRSQEASQLAVACRRHGPPDAGEEVQVFEEDRDGHDDFAHCFSDCERLFLLACLL